jgi:hypothetical protein
MNNKMKEQKVIIGPASDVNFYLEKGWEVISVTSAHTTYFCFCFVIQKQ